MNMTGTINKFDNSAKSQYSFFESEVNLNDTNYFGGKNKNYQKLKDFRRNPKAFTTICIFFMIIAIFIFISGFSAFKVYYGKVEAVKVDSKLKNNFYYGKYEYTVNEQNYFVYSDTGYNRTEFLKDNIILYYRLDNPSSATETPQRTEKFALQGISKFVIGGGIFFGAIIVMIVLKTNYKKLKNLNGEEAKEIISNVIEDNSLKDYENSEKRYTICEYCGSKIEKTDKKCPVCGATNKNKKIKF